MLNLKGGIKVLLLSIMGGGEKCGVVVLKSYPRNGNLYWLY